MIAQIIITLIICIHIFGLKKKKYFWLFLIPIMYFLVFPIHLGYQFIINAYAYPEFKLDTKMIGRTLVYIIFNYVLIIVFFNKIMEQLTSLTRTKKELLFYLYSALFALAILSVYLIQISLSS
jgi:carbon starvation protein CstA